MAAVRPVDPEAHEDYLNGIFFMRPFTAESMRRALEHLDRAIELDPDFALAHA